ncbi:MAG: zinc-ribbon domain-containing protein, partial [Caldilineaceae bacterium]|nr:zinc-ribbon domain-containing protein [Caldilineaceae bacterium]
MNVIHCPHCGTTNRVGSNFCNRCGADLRGDEADESVAAPTPDSSPGLSPDLSAE